MERQRQSKIKKEEGNRLETRKKNSAQFKRAITFPPRAVVWTIVSSLRSWMTRTSWIYEKAQQLFG